MLSVVEAPYPIKTIINSLKVKKIIITGASRGIGRAATLSLAAKGAKKILAIARSQQALEDLKTIIESQYPQAE